MDSGYSPLACPVCIDDYDEQNHVPMMGCCGHSVCSTCIENLVNRTCPFCQGYGSFDMPCKNYTAIELLAKFKDLSKKKTSGDNICIQCKGGFGKEKTFVCLECFDENEASTEARLKKAKVSRLCIDCSEAINRHGGHFLKNYEEFEAKLKGNLFLEDVSNVIETANADISLLQAKFSEIQKPGDTLKEAVERINAHLAANSDLSAVLFDTLSQKVKEFGEDVKKKCNKGISVVEELNDVLKGVTEFMKRVYEGNRDIPSYMERLEI